MRITCPACAMRYGLIVDPACPVCRGAGTIAAAVPDGIDPLIAARAVTINLYTHVDLRELRDKGLLVADSPDAGGLTGVPTDHADRAQVGKKATMLLRGGKPKPFIPRTPKPPPPLPTPEQLEQAQLERQRRMAEWEGIRRERELAAEQAERERRAARRALTQLVEAHRDELDEVLEGERAMAAIEDMPVIRRRPWSGS